MKAQYDIASLLRILLYTDSSQSLLHLYRCNLFIDTHRNIGEEVHGDKQITSLGRENSLLYGAEQTLHQDCLIAAVITVHSCKY